MKRFWRIVGVVSLAGLSAAVLRALRQSSRQQRAGSTVDSFETRARPDAPAGAPLAAGVLGSSADPGTGIAADKDVADEPPPPPPPPPLVIFGQSAAEVEQAQQLWLTLQHETYQQRADGFLADWAFPLYASRTNLGAPLAPGSRLRVGDKEYAFQPFARGILYSEVPNWSDVRDLTGEIGGSIPADGRARQLLDAAFRESGSPLVASQAFSQVAVRENLGPALGPGYRIAVGNQEYSMQVFAGDTLYNLVPDWGDVKRLSETAPGELYLALWRETYRHCNAIYNPDSPAHKFAAKEKLGAPLSGVYQIDFEGNMISVQVFALDTIFTDADGAFKRQSELARPAMFTVVEKRHRTFLPLVISPTTAPDTESRNDATSSKRLTFRRLPIDGQPRISQFYGYTKFARGAGAGFYRACQGRHPGIDFAVPVGTPLRAVAHGLVVYAGPTSSAPFGGSPPEIVIVRYGDVYAIYGHCAETRVRRGQFVKPGDLVALSGSLGGPHLHFELRPVPQRVLRDTNPNQNGVNPGNTFNPLSYFAADLQPYFERWYRQLGGRSHFCCDDLRTQGEIWFGGPIDTRPCTN